MAEVCYNLEDGQCGYCATGNYSVCNTHELKNPLYLAIEEFEAVAMRFSLDVISDAEQRGIYQSRIKAMSDQVLRDVSTGKMKLVDGVAYCNEMRNQIMRETRVALSAEGKAWSQWKKPDTGVSLEEMLNRKSNELFEKPYESLSKVKRDSVYYEIITSGGRHDVKVTTGTEKLRLMGRVCIVVTAVLATYFIVTAEDKKREALKQGAAIGGGALAGLAVSPICGPGAPVCAIVVVIAGSTAGALAADAAATAAYDAAFMEEAEEFSKWVN